MVFGHSAGVLGKLGLILPVGLVMLLAGCDYFPSDHLAVQQRGESLRVAFCEGASLTEIHMEERITFPGEWQPFFDARVSIQLTPGTVLSTGELPLTDTRWHIRSPTLAPDGQLLVSYYDEAEETGKSAGFTIPHSGLPEVGWLQPDDAGITDEACPADPADK